MDEKKIANLFLDERIVDISIRKMYETSNGLILVKEICLYNEQKKELVTMITRSKFEQVTSTTFSYKSKIRYFVIGNNSDGNTILKLESYGDEFIILDWNPGDVPSKHLRLKIKKSKWSIVLENMLNGI